VGAYKQENVQEITKPQLIFCLTLWGKEKAMKERKRTCGEKEVLKIENKGINIILIFLYYVEIYFCDGGEW